MAAGCGVGARLLARRLRLAVCASGLQCLQRRDQHGKCLGCVPFLQQFARVIAHLAATGYFFLNDGLTSIVLCLIEGKGLKQIRMHWKFYVLPYTLLGSTLATGWMLLRGQIPPEEMQIAGLVIYSLYCVLRRSISEQGVLGLRASSANRLV